MKILPLIKKRWRLATIWARHHKKTTIFSLCALFTLTFGGAVFAATYQQPVAVAGTIPITEPRPQVKKPQPAKQYYSPLTGLPVKNEAATKKAVTAIMIENSPAARPQSGIADAEVVYEAIAEGGVTRFLALYQNSKPNLVGPVRSLRMYYLDWLAPYDASVAHVGGSYYSLQDVRNGNYRDIDQFFNAGAYWRASDRYAPHNVYTSFKKLDALNTSKGYKTSSPKQISRIDTKKPAKPTTTRISVDISNPTYNSSYIYDGASNTYLRSMGGEPHVDREKGQIRVGVVVVLKTEVSDVFEDGWRMAYRTTGTGDATIFQNGTAIKATWHKQDRNHQLFFTGSDGKKLPLARGKTWITVIGGNGGVSWQ